jgi:ABC-2 type transport system ATP-binding protein
MRQKTALAGALIHDPQVLFLDEPTIGLDPRSARTIKDLLRGLCDRGKAVFLLDPRARDRRAAVRPGRDPVAGESWRWWGSVAELRERARSSASLEEIFLGLTGGTEGADLAAFFDP